MLLTQALLAAPFILAYLIAVALGISYILVLIYNAIVVAITKNESKQLPALKTAIILAILILGYFIYKVITDDSPMLN